MRLQKKIMFDVIVIFILGFCGRHMDLYWSPAERGYICGDPSIQYPMLENTVSPRQVLMVSFFVPLTIILLTGVVSNQDIRAVYENTSAFLIGTGLVYVSSNLMKFNLGMLRPYFLSVCRPEQSCVKHLEPYVVDAKCTGNPFDIRAARLTFPSLHSSLSSYGAVFIMVYLHMLNKKGASPTVADSCTAITQVFFFAWYLYVAVSRVQDFRHHLSDVIGGSILGLAIALFTLYRLSGRGGSQGHNDEDTKETKVD